MATNTYLLNEEKNQTKSRKITIMVHAALLLLLIFPFMKFETPKPEVQAVVVLNFDDEFKSAAAKSSTKKATTKKAVTKKPVKKPVVKKTPVKKPTPKPTAKKKPVLKTKRPERKIETKPNKAEKKVDVPMKDPVPDVPEVPEKTEKEAKETPKAETGGAAAETGKTTGNGEGKQGSSDKGDSKTDGVADKGKNGMDFSGNGIFNRKVTYRADVKKVTKEEGKIVINLCINQQGRVVYGKINEDLTTIDTKKVQKKALSVATDYRFERDYTAPKKQCGKLTFIFEIEEE